MQFYRNVLAVGLILFLCSCSPKVSENGAGGAGGGGRIPAEIPFVPSVPPDSFTIQSAHFAQSGNLLYRCNRYDGIQVVDLTQGPDSVVGNHKTGGFCENLALAGNLLYVGDGFAFRILDITDPFNIRELGSVPSQAFCTWFSVDRGYAYVTDYAYGHFIVDVRNPQAPVRIWTDTSLGDLWYPFTDGQGALFLNDTGMGLRVLDISNPSAPTEMYRFDPLPGHVLSSLRLGQHLYVALAYAGLHVYDLGTTGPLTTADLASATLIQQMPIINIGGYDHFLRLFDGKLYLAAGWDGVRVFSIGANGKLTQTYSDTSFGNFDVVEVFAVGSQLFLYSADQQTKFLSMP